MWDVTIVDTVAQSYVAATSHQAGAAADAAENCKRSKYRVLENQFRAVDQGRGFVFFYFGEVLC